MSGPRSRFPLSITEMIRSRHPNWLLCANCGRSRSLLLRSGVVFIALIDQSTTYDLRIREKQTAATESSTNWILGRGWLEAEANLLAPRSLDFCILLLFRGFCTREQ